MHYACIHQEGKSVAEKKEQGEKIAISPLKEGKVINEWHLWLWAEHKHTKQTGMEENRQERGENGLKKEIN